MDRIKEAFDKIKYNLSSLNTEVIRLRKDIEEVKRSFLDVYRILRVFDKELFKLQYLNDLQIPTQMPKFPTEIKGYPTHQQPIKALKNQNIGISIGNKGVPTDRQTDRQTDQQTQNSLNLKEFSWKILEKRTEEKIEKNTIDSAAEIIDSLDSIKKQIRLKFKKFTEQEMLVFSTIYQFDEERGFSTYKLIADKLKLTESSIRDYVGRLLKKQAPIDKIKANNKEIELRIHPNLKRITTLSTILKLREL